jgi:hypothetical protein
MIIDAKEKHVITLQNGIWMFSDTMLGATDESIVLYFKSPDNARMYEEVKNLTYPDMVMKRKQKETK